MPKLSIIIPTYNVEKYISVCLESLRKQTFEDWEAIVVNDGSSDNSGIICNDFAKKDSRIKVYHQKNSGVSAARNFGLLKAEGEFITFVDSDDMLLNSYLNNFSYDPSLDFEVQGFT
ncbi:glycosyltransferase family 2 protein, partial [Bacteroides sp.]|uniref:glycosyltransferase family 2 protein n=1 Tax=Bacteroides sp. TaxID=29523 RepID=UPI003A8D0E55